MDTVRPASALARILRVKRPSRRAFGDYEYLGMIVAVIGFLLEVLKR